MLAHWKVAQFYLFWMDGSEGSSINQHLLVQASSDPVSPEADSLVHRVLNVSKWGL